MLFTSLLDEVSSRGSVMVIYCVSVCFCDVFRRLVALYSC